MGFIFKSVGSLLIMGGVVALSFVGTQFANKLDLVNDLAKAKEDIRLLEEAKEKLAMANRFLKVDYLMAKVRLKTQYREKDTGKMMSVVEFLEVDDQENPLAQPMEFHIRGGEVYIDGLVAKFDDEYVEAGDPRRGTALFVFRRLFGDEDVASNGYLIPTNRGQQGAYAQGGLPTKLEEKFWTEFWGHAHDEAWMKQNGLKAMQGTAATIQLRDGFEYRVKLGARGDFTIETKSTKPTAGGLLNSSRKAGKPWRAD